MARTASDFFKTLSSNDNNDVDFVLDGYLYLAHWSRPKPTYIEFDPGEIYVRSFIRPTLKTENAFKQVFIEKQNIKLEEGLDIKYNEGIEDKEGSMLSSRYFGKNIKDIKDQHNMDNCSRYFYYKAKVLDCDLIANLKTESYFNLCVRTMTMFSNKVTCYKRIPDERTVRADEAAFKEQCLDLQEKMNATEESKKAWIEKLTKEGNHVLILMNF